MAKATESYENNPFTIGHNGITLLFEKAKSVALYAIVLCVVLFIFNAMSGEFDYKSAPLNEAQIAQQQTANEAAVTAFFAQDIGTLLLIGVLVATVVFLVIVISLWLYGALEYTGAQLAKNHKTTLKEALRESGKDLASYVWLWAIIIIKVLLWSLLFIIPGFIMAVRYSLAGTVFFAEGKRGNAAVKRSLELTKGAWFTTFAGSALWNIITLGQISYLLQPGINAVLYRQFKPLTDSGKTKPNTHWLSIATLVAPIALLGFVVSIGIMIALLVTMFAG
ncbi:hypothetical protein H7142_03950 [Candidatus Saccharibacteria bacterium]|nr:hypothetical protein [Candidatus Saccharibacteria bacterium]